jgi:hypothetical protein
MIIRSAAIKLHQWEREEEHLDYIKRIASAKARRAKPLFVSEEFEHTALVQCPPGGALNSAV